MEPAIFSEAIEIENVLIGMGLTQDELIRAVRFAESERALVTDNDPIGFANMTAYAKSGRKLREIYLPRGWVKDDTNNQCAIKNPQTKVRIVPCNFDEAAGDRLQTPANKSPKGEISRKKSMCNRTAWLPGIVDSKAPVDDEGYKTWVLGIFIEDGHPTRAELSLPVDFDGNYFTQFGTRVILLDGTDEAFSEEQPAEEDAFEIIDIQIKKK